MRVTEPAIRRILGPWVFGLNGVAQQQPGDALKLLEPVAKHYEEAETVHIEMTEQATSHALRCTTRQRRGRYLRTRLGEGASVTKAQAGMVGSDRFRPDR